MAGLYDSKAIAGPAHGYQFGRRLRQDELSGGVAHTVPQLRGLAFEIEDTWVPGVSTPASVLAEREHGRIYSWQNLGEMLGFGPGWLNRTGGMGSLPRGTTRY